MNDAASGELFTFVVGHLKSLLAFGLSVLIGIFRCHDALCIPVEHESSNAHAT